MLATGADPLTSVETLSVAPQVEPVAEIEVASVDVSGCDEVSVQAEVEAVIPFWSCESVGAGLADSSAARYDASVDPGVAALAGETG